MSSTEHNTKAEIKLGRGRQEALWPYWERMVVTSDVDSPFGFAI